MNATPKPEEERAAPDDRIAARMKRKASKESTWPGFSLFWGTYPHPPVLNATFEDALECLARSTWEMGRPSRQLIRLILLTVGRSPSSTLDPQTGRRRTAAEFLMLLWPAPTPEALRKYLEDPEAGFEEPAKPEDLLRALWDPAEVQVLIDTAEGPHERA